MAAPDAGENPWRVLARVDCDAVDLLVEELKVVGRPGTTIVGAPRDHQTLACSDQQDRQSHRSPSRSCRDRRAVYTSEQKKPQIRGPGAHRHGDQLCKVSED